MALCFEEYLAEFSSEKIQCLENCGGDDDDGPYQSGCKW